MLSVSKSTFIWLFISFCYVKSENDEITCELAAFLENLDGTKPILIDSGSLSTTTEFKSCKENATDCARLVEEQAIEGTNGGNFTLSVDKGSEYTVGDMLCDKADAVEENVRHKIVHIYWRMCRSAWKPTSFKMPEPLCCEDGLYVPCQKFKSEL